MTDKDSISTIAGGGAGLSLLLTVHWDAVPWGETVKIVVSVLLIWLRYCMYQKPSKPS